VDRPRRIILGEGLHLSTMTLCAALGVEPHGAVAGSRKLTVRLKEKTGLKREPNAGEQRVKR
jgi:hypothetical protein